MSRSVIDTSQTPLHDEQVDTLSSGADGEMLQRSSDCAHAQQASKDDITQHKLHSSNAGSASEVGTMLAPSDRVMTVPNLISFIRLCLIPLYFSLLLGGNNVAAAITFAVAAGTDFIDGQVARRTHQVSKLGSLLDPLVDRLLMITGVLGVFLVGRVPCWIIAVVMVRDISLVLGYGYVLRTCHIRIPVIYPGKVATTLFFVGFAALIINWPLVSGLGIVSASWLPGFNDQSVGWGIWCIYAGLLLGAVTTTYYVKEACRGIRNAKAKGHA